MSPSEKAQPALDIDAARAWLRGAEQALATCEPNDVPKARDQVDIARRAVELAERAEREAATDARRVELRLVLDALRKGNPTAQVEALAVARLELEEEHRRAVAKFEAARLANANEAARIIAEHNTRRATAIQLARTLAEPIPDAPALRPGLFGAMLVALATQRAHARGEPNEPNTALEHACEAAGVAPYGWAATTRERLAWPAMEQLGAIVAGTFEAEKAARVAADEVASAESERRYKKKQARESTFAYVRDHGIAEAKWCVRQHVDAGTFTEAEASEILSELLTKHGAS